MKAPVTQHTLPSMNSPTSEASQNEPITAPAIPPPIRPHPARAPASWEAGFPEWLEIA